MRGKNNWRGATRGRRFENFNEGKRTIEIGVFVHETIEKKLVFRCSKTLIPKFFSQIFLDTKAPIGKVDDVFGPIDNYYFSVDPCDGIHGSSLKEEEKVFIDENRILRIEKFVPNRVKDSVSALGRINKPSSIKRGGKHLRGRGGLRGKIGGLRGYRKGR